MDPREYLLRYFTDLDKIDIPINVKDNSFGGRLSRFGSRIGTPVKNFINRKASIPNLLTPRSSTIPSPWGGSITSSPVVNTLGGEVVDVVSSKPQSLLSKVRGLPQRLAGNSQVQKLLGGVSNPVTRRFAGKLGPLKNVPYLNPVIATGMGIHRLGEGKAPLDAFGRPLFQVGGGILGAGTGFLADSPFSPAADIALGYAGWEGGGRLYDALRGLTNTATTEQEHDDITTFNAEGLRVIDDGSQTGVPVTEGVGTKLVRMPDGTVIRVPIETEIGDSTVISQDGIPVNEVIESEGKTISDKVGNFLDRADWESSRRYRNSPAVKSGAFTADQLWQQQLRHREWQKENNRGPYRVQDNPDTPNNEAHEAARAASVNRRNQRLIDKGLKPINPRNNA